jgi:hypothetical protein
MARSTIRCIVESEFSTLSIVAHGMVKRQNKGAKESPVVDFRASHGKEATEIDLKNAIEPVRQPVDMPKSA